MGLLLIEIHLNLGGAWKAPVSKDSKDGFLDGFAGIDELVFHLEAEYFRVLFDPVGDHLDVHLNVPELEPVSELIVFRIVDEIVDARHLFKSLPLQTLPEYLRLNPLDLLI